MRTILVLLILFFLIVTLTSCFALSNNNEMTAPICEELVDVDITETAKNTNILGIEYILNTRSNKFHYPSCASAKRISEKNREEYFGTREELIADGYSPCGNCDP